MIVRIELRRENGMALVIMEGAANAPLDWRPPLTEAGLVDLLGHYVLSGFSYRPVVEKFPEKESHARNP